MPMACNLKLLLALTPLLPALAVERAQVPIYGSEAAGNWVVKLPGHWNSGQVGLLSEGLPGSSHISFKGDPSAGGLGVVLLKANWKDLQAFLSMHPEVSYVEQDKTEIRDTGAPAPPRALSAAPRLVEVQGMCTNPNTRSKDAIYQWQGSTASGAPYYRNAQYWLYYDPSCDGALFGPTWRLSTSQPSLTAAMDLDGDGRCGSLAFLESARTDVPLGSATWTVTCLGEWELQRVTLSLPADPPQAITIHGDCPDPKGKYNGQSFSLQGTLAGAPYYSSPLYHLIYEPQCDFELDSTLGSWLLTANPPARLTGLGDFQADGPLCTNAKGYHFSRDPSKPPLGAQQWILECADDDWETVNLDIRSETSTWTPWSLDRLDQRQLPLSNSYTGHSDAGRGVHIYVVDDGIRYTHQDFGGRALPALDVVNQAIVECNPQNFSCGAAQDSHGTATASVAGGAMFGIAKSATLHSVKIYNSSGDGSLFFALEALDWLLRKARKPAIITMGFWLQQTSRSLQEAVEASLDTNIPVVVYAGSGDRDACTISPGNIVGAITVSITDRTDRRWSQSNWGSCVDIFAPGVEYPAASYLWDSDGARFTGGSAYAYITGAVATILAMDISLTPRQLKDILLGQATQGVVSDAKGSPNRLLFLSASFVLTSTSTSTTRTSTRTTTTRTSTTRTSTTRTSTTRTATTSTLTSSTQTVTTRTLTTATRTSTTRTSTTRTSTARTSTTTSRTSTSSTTTTPMLVPRCGCDSEQLQPGELACEAAGACGPAGLLTAQQRHLALWSCSGRGQLCQVRGPDCNAATDERLQVECQGLEEPRLCGEQDACSWSQPPLLRASCVSSLPGAVQEATCSSRTDADACSIQFGCMWRLEAAEAGQRSCGDGDFRPCRSRNSAEQGTCALLTREEGCRDHNLFCTWNSEEPCICPSTAFGKWCEEDVALWTSSVQDCAAEHSDVVKEFCFGLAYSAMHADPQRDLGMTSPTCQSNSGCRQGHQLRAIVSQLEISQQLDIVVDVAGLVMVWVVCLAKCGGWRPDRARSVAVASIVVVAFALDFSFDVWMGINADSTSKTFAELKQSHCFAGQAYDQMVLLADTAQTSSLYSYLMAITATIAVFFELASFTLDMIDARAAAGGPEVADAEVPPTVIGAPASGSAPAEGAPTIEEGSARCIRAEILATLLNASVLLLAHLELACVLREYFLNTKNLLSSVVEINSAVLTGTLGALCVVRNPKLPQISDVLLQDQDDTVLKWGVGSVAGILVLLACLHVFKKCRRLLA